jgi:hypothetical protein
MRHARAMARRSAVEVPADLRARLEAARLDLLALFRTLDRMDLAPSEIPQRLIRQLFELDADYAEALWALDQPPERWISQPCFAILWPRWPSYLKPRLTSVTTFLGVLIPPCPNWKSPFAKVCYQQKRTTWSQVVIPKTVKHPLAVRLAKFAPDCINMSLTCQQVLNFSCEPSHSWKSHNSLLWSAII